MDFSTLVDEITARVTERMEQTESTCAAVPERPKLLVLNREHNENCHRILESSRICAKYETVCALLENYLCDPGEFEAVLLYGLDNESLSKIASGICDTPYTALAVKTILKGRKIYAVREDVELFGYEQTAPPVYYGMMLEKAKLLERSGIIFCSGGEIEELVLGDGGGCAAAACPEPAKELSICKKVIAEKDVTAAFAQGARILRVGAKSILTDLARDYAHERGIKIERE